MAAAQVLTTSTAVVASDPDQWRMVFVSNLGPNVIYLEVGATATTTTGLPVPATTGTIGPLHLPPGQALNAIAATANQVSPADTRVVPI
jgi:hypothetical protein